MPERSHKKSKIPGDEVTTEQKTGCVDKFSCLPLVIIHDILSKTYFKEAVTTCVLSKKWRTIWASRPVLDFHEPLFHALGLKEAFLTFLESSLDYHHKYGYSGTEISHLSLDMKVEQNSHSEANRLVNKCIDFAFRNRVRVLQLHLKMPQHSQHFDLRDKTYFTATLDSLDIHNCEITNCSFMIPNLRSLSLYNVCIENSDLGNFIAGCPRIEELSIERCAKFFDLVVSNPALKSFSLGWPNGGAKIQIKSTNLESFQLSTILVKKDRVEINSMKTVKRLTLHEVHYQKRTLMNFIKKFPQLEELSIDGCTGLRSLHVSQANLTSFLVRKCNGIKEITIDAPKLKSLEYAGGLTSFPGIKSSKALEFVKLHLRTRSLDGWSDDDWSVDDWSVDDCLRDDRWYIWLRNTLESFAHSKHLSLICSNAKEVIFPCELTERLLPTINDLKNLEVQLFSCNTATSQRISDSFNRILSGLKTLTLTTLTSTGWTTSKLVELPQGG